MSNLRKNIIIGICGIIVVIVTITTFFLMNFNNSTTAYIGFGFLIFSQVALFLGLMINFSYNNAPNNVFMRTGVTSCFVFYFIATAILLFVSGQFNESINAFITFEIILLAIMLIVTLTIVSFGIKISNNEQKTLSDRKLMQICEKRISDLVTKNKNKACEPQLVVIHEKLKYCDKIGVSSVDEKIVGTIMKLERELQVENDVTKIFSELSSLILQRNSEIAELKRGGF